MIKIKIGEQKSINYTLKIKSSGLPINLVNSTIIFQLKDDKEKTTDFLLEKTITENSDADEVGQIYDAENGKFSIFLKSEDTMNLDLEREYFYTIWRFVANRKEVISASGKDVAKFIVYPD